ncbi:hypothetical protein SODALDRAFT_335036 [Sodiomyces alkalinus F11]|uniref:Sodium/calcium exchanger membrane region domain-containing protein n=1 Tax=Sodiomyces alkalinus (strain CBS 110278 / VKM F-3762 / F11) TaxID=1314773 RepID=A0A3N2PQU3_SODAK|nr:hypothetical protein SODALDRAFT_335036 [Sodiomyces alkalinus F11]ROT36830.1 hypothetical protein SODALDRAFT_335036 [Sodiomyces alkalinus F11]
MTASKIRGAKPSLRAFYATAFIISSLAAYSFIAPLFSQARLDLDSPLLVSRSARPKDCHDVRDALDQCAFVKAYCGDDEAGLLSYLTPYYCGFSHLRGIAFILLVCWLGLLFTTIGIAASDFFSVNLSTIASILGLSESLAGVTFLAFGNGSPDVFSTFAAMGSNSASMAVGELIGAASFITAVVAGSMAVVREFKVGRRTYIRDLCFFIVSVVFTMIFLADGYLHLWECMAMIGYYVFYVVCVVGWHWFSTRQRRRRVRDAAARSHVYGAVGHPNDELAPVPYRDEPGDDEAGPVGGGSRADEADIGLLEAGPRIEIDGHEISAGDGSPEEDEHLGTKVAAEMTSSMRVLRPRGRRSTTITPIRPSLVGALEFRSALAQLQRESNLRLRPVYGHRAYSDYHVEGNRNNRTTGGAGASARHEHPAAHAHLGHGEATGRNGRNGRNRALSANDVPPSFRFLPLPAIESDADAGPSGTSASTSPPQGPSPGRTRSPSPSYQIGGNLAPPPVDPSVPRVDAAAVSQRHTPRLVIPEFGAAASDSGRSSPMSPFPAFQYTDSPLLLTPLPQEQHADSFPQPTASRFEASLPPPLPVSEPRPVKWWPHSVLPPPHVLQTILFPTLQGWREKTVWDKLVSAISVPSILLLVITLPVVETESDDYLDGDSPHPSPLLSDIRPQPVSVRPHAAIAPETEWQRYRRHSTRERSRSPTSGSFHRTSPVLIALEPPGDDDVTGAGTGLSQGVEAGTAGTAGTAASESDAAFEAEEESAGWNRWLVALQLFTGPQFAMLVLWANMREDLEQPGKTLLRMFLYTSLASLVLLVFLLLTTSPNRRPRHHFVLCFLGFVISVAWISTIAGEVVGVLKAFGVILGISEALLGLTIFAAGNSVGDLVADMTVARLGYPVMALSACFGGPMLNILLGIGIGGVWMMMKAADHWKKKHPDKPVKYKPYQIQIDGTLMISAVTLLVTLLLLLVVVPMNKWMLSRKIGYSLIALWAVGTVVNIAVEVTGVWTDVTS